VCSRKKPRIALILLGFFQMHIIAYKFFLIESNEGKVAKFLKKRRGKVLKGFGTITLKREKDPLVRMINRGSYEKYLWKSIWTKKGKKGTVGVEKKKGGKGRGT